MMAVLWPGSHPARALFGGALASGAIEVDQRQVLLDLRRLQQVNAQNAIVIRDIRLLEKTGGKRAYRAP